MQRIKCTHCTHCIHSRSDTSDSAPFEVNSRQIAEKLYPRTSTWWNNKQKTRFLGVHFIFSFKAGLWNNWRLHFAITNCRRLYLRDIIFLLLWMQVECCNRKLRGVSEWLPGWVWLNYHKPHEDIFVFLCLCGCDIEFLCVIAAQLLCTKQSVFVDRQNKREWRRRDRKRRGREGEGIERGRMGWANGRMG